MRKHIFFLLLLLFFSCKREKASWLSNWNVPLISDSLTMDDWEEKNLVSWEGSNYNFILDRTIFELKLSDLVKIPDTSIDHSYSIPLASINVPPGASFVNSTLEHEFDLAPAQIKKIRVKSGGVLLTVKNPLGTKVTFNVQLPGVSKNGEPLNQNFLAQPGTVTNPSITEAYVDLTAYDLDLRGPSLNSFNILQSKLTITSDPNGESVNLTNSDVFLFNFKISNITLDYARGYFGSQTFSKTSNQNIELLNKIVSGSIDLPTLNLGIGIENGFKMNAQLRLNGLSNTNNELNLVNLAHPIVGNWQSISSATGTNSANLQASSTDFTFSSTNSNIENFLENHGANNTVDVDLKLNPWGNTSGGWDEVYDEHPLKVNLTGDIPLSIGFDNFIIADTFSLKLVQNPNKTSIREGEIWLKATNAFPLQGKIEIVLLNGNTIVGTLSSNTNLESSVFGSIVNGIQQTKSDLLFPISVDLAQNINGVTRCVVRVELDSPNIAPTNVPVVIPEHAFISFKLGTRLKVNQKL